MTEDSRTKRKTAQQQDGNHSEAVRENPTLVHDTGTKRELDLDQLPRTAYIRTHVSHTQKFTCETPTENDCTWTNLVFMLLRYVCMKVSWWARPKTYITPWTWENSWGQDTARPLLLWAWCVVSKWPIRAGWSLEPSNPWRSDLLTQANLHFWSAARIPRSRDGVSFHRRQKNVFKVTRMSSSVHMCVRMWRGCWTAPVQGHVQLCLKVAGIPLLILTH